MAKMQIPCFHLKKISTTFKTLSVYLCSRSSVSIQPPEVGRKYERKTKQVSNVSFVEGVNTKASSTDLGGAMAK